MKLDFKKMLSHGILSYIDDDTKLNVIIVPNNRGFRVTVTTSNEKTIKLTVDESPEFDYEVYSKSDMFYGTSDTFMGITADDSAITSYIEELINTLRDNVYRLG